MGGFSWIHIVILLVVVLLVFGTKKLRGAGKDLGGMVKDFKDGIKGGEEAAKASTDAPPPAAAPNVIEGEAKREKV
jgi:sec-independent protein translocase protein TatA